MSRAQAFITAVCNGMQNERIADALEEVIGIYYKNYTDAVELDPEMFDAIRRICELIMLDELDVIDRAEARFLGDLADRHSRLEVS